MGAAARQQVQDNADQQIPESELFKAIEDLESTALKKSTALPDGYMRTTDEARGGQISQVLDPGPGSREDLKPTGHEGRSEFDMEGAEGESRAAKAYHGKGKGKMDDDDDDDDDKKTSKSMRKSMEARQSIKKAVEVSKFLEELVDANCDSFAGLSKSVTSFHKGQSEFNGSIRKALVAYGNEIVRLNGNLEALLNQPRGGGVHKSVLTKSDIADRNFRQSDGVDQGGDDTQSETKISKAQVSDLLYQWFTKGEIPGEAVTEFETTNRMTKPLARKVQQHFATAAE